MSPPFRNAPWPRLGAGILALSWLVSCEINKLLQDGGASDPPPARLEFAPPANGTAGEPLSPAVRVSAMDSSGSVDTTFRGAVTVTLGEHPAGAELRGAHVVDAVRGVASFADLSINRSGTGYTLVATSPGVRGATSPASDVGPAAAARLVFTAPPHSAKVDGVLAPPVQVTAFDTLDNVATGFADNVTVALAANASGGTLGGTTTVTAASGVATFADLSVNRAGTGYRLTASAGQLTGATSDPFDITAGPPTTGDLTVNATTTGDDQPGSYTVTVDGGRSRSIGPSDTLTCTGLGTGSHAVRLNGVPSNCSVSEATPQTVTVSASSTAEASFTITCQALTGSLTVTTSTSGGSPDPDGYTVTVSDGGSQPIGRNETVTFADLAIGNHTVTLSDVASNCSVSGGASRTVAVTTGPPVSVTFTVDCPTVPPPTGSLTVSTSTSGGTLDPDGYTFTVDGGSGRAIGINTSVTVDGLSPGSHTVVLSGIAANCSISGGTSRTVTVTAGQTATVSFSVDCSTPPPPTGSVTVSTSTTGGTLDPDGYTFTVDGGSGRAIGINTSVTVDGLSPGSQDRKRVV